MATTTTTNKGAQALASYWRETKDPGTIIILLLPLFLIYSVGILTTRGLRNGVDLFSDFARNYLFKNDLYYGLFMLFALAGMIIALVKMKEKRIFNPKIFLGIILEGTVYGFLMGEVVSHFLLGLSSCGLAAGVSSCGAGCNFIMSIGAGFWEEIVFRLLLVGLPVLFLTKLWPQHRTAIVISVIIVSSLIFSTIHYVGALADSFSVYSFLFRFNLGVILAVIYYLRGLAVGVYTHAVYDVMVLVF